MRFTHIVAVVIVNAIFAGSYIAGKMGVNHFDPLFFSAMRFLLVFIALLPFFRLPRLSPERRAAFFGFCLGMGAGVYAPMYLSLAYADGVTAVLIGTQFSVPMAVLLGIWLSNERVSRLTWGGILLAFGGVMLVGFDEVVLGYGVSFALVLLSAFFYAAANVLSKQLGGAINVLNLNAWMALLSAPLMFALSFLFEEAQWASLQSADAPAWTALLYSALAVSIIGHCGMFALLRHHPVSVVMPYYVLVPIFGVIGGIVFFSEAPTPAFYVGAAIALSGVWIVNTRAARR